MNHMCEFIGTQFDVIEKVIENVIEKMKFVCEWAISLKKMTEVYLKDDSIKRAGFTDNVDLSLSVIPDTWKIGMVRTGLGRGYTRQGDY